MRGNTQPFVVLIQRKTNCLNCLVQTGLKTIIVPLIQTRLHYTREPSRYLERKSISILQAIGNKAVSKFPTVLCDEHLTSAASENITVRKLELGYVTKYLEHSDKLSTCQW